MSLRNLFIILVLGLLTVFAAVNWNAIMAPTDLSLIFTTVHAPLGLMLLAITSLLILLFLGYVVYMQSSVLMAKKRLGRDLEEQRKLANEAETSRFTELQTYLQKELALITAQNNDVHNKLDARLNDMETAVKATVEESGTTLSAYIGELGDRLDKK
jgi:uncharacterized integral membrane protein